MRDTRSEIQRESFTKVFGFRKIFGAWIVYEN